MIADILLASGLAGVAASLMAMGGPSRGPAAGEDRLSEPHTRCLLTGAEAAAFRAEFDAAGRPRAGHRPPGSLVP